MGPAPPVSSGASAFTTTLVLAFGRVQNMGLRKVAAEEIRLNVRKGGAFLYNGPKASQKELHRGRGLFIMVLSCAEEEKNHLLEQM